MEIVLDTSFLVTAIACRIDPFEAIDKAVDGNIEFAVLDKTVRELEKLINESKYSDKKAAQLALKLVKSKGLKIITTEDGYADDLLVCLDAMKCIVATQDKGLKKRLKDKGFRVITLRQKKYAVMV